MTYCVTSVWPLYGPQVIVQPDALARLLSTHASNASAPWFYAIAPVRHRMGCPSRTYHRADTSPTLLVTHPHPHPHPLILSPHPHRIRLALPQPPQPCIGPLATLGDPTYNMGVAWPRGAAAALLSAAVLRTIGRGPSKTMAVEEMVRQPTDRSTFSISCTLTFTLPVTCADSLRTCLHPARPSPSPRALDLRQLLRVRSGCRRCPFERLRSRSKWAVHSRRSSSPLLLPSPSTPPLCSKLCLCPDVPRCGG